MAVAIAITKSLLDPLPRDVRSFVLRDATARALSRQPENTLSSGIRPVGDTAFNRSQLPRLLQEVAFLAKASDEQIGRELEEAASFIEAEIAALGPAGDYYVVFLGD